MMKKVLWTVGGVAAAFVVAVMFWPSTSRYQGKTVSSWVEQLRSSNEVARWEAVQAVQSLGTSAVPLLVDKMRASDSSLRSNAIAVLQQQSLIPVPRSPARESREEAVRGFAALGASEGAVLALVRMLGDPQTADHASYALTQMDNRVVPALLVAITNSGLQVRRRVIADLGYRHTNAPGVAPALVDRMRNDPDPTTRSMAATALGGGLELDAAAIAALIDALGDPVVSLSAAQSLGKAGPAARDAVMALEKMDRAGGGYSIAARQALFRIDPSALAGMGTPFVPATNRYE